MPDDFELTPIANAIRGTQYFTLASSTLYLYDLLLTLDLEVDLLWPSKWTLLKMIYLLQRYLPLIDMVIVTITWQFGEISNLHTCKALFQESNWSYLVGMTLSEIVLTYRTLAVRGNTTKLRRGLLLFFLVCMAPLYWTMAKILSSSFTYHSLPIPGMYCFPIGGPGLSYLCWTLLTVYDTGEPVRQTPDSAWVDDVRPFDLDRDPGFPSIASRVIRQSKLSQVVYQDGVLYYLYLVALSVINVILTLRLPGNPATLFVTSVERVLYSILTSHVVLHMREQPSRTSDTTTSESP
ncbi:hypothetical protein BDN72DRAFT_902498 [Pluteus cervinus]|uniref:Uncharacterized protein n=1 Tax=Pluteus cervinus TaxID=181527 RepID=A0ACD3ACJ1_9AGAR|nr:hypothetical protein BDN72DRAFT_902498 [Pluteus cervinus]